MREFATVAEIADEIRRRLGTRLAENAPVLATPSKSDNVIRLADVIGGDDRAFLESLYNQVLGRPPGPDEIAAALSHLRGCTRTEYANEFQRSAEARGRGVVILDLLSPSEQVQYSLPALLESAPPVEPDRLVYHLSDLLRFEGAAYVVNLYRSLLKCPPDEVTLRGHLDTLSKRRSTPLEILLAVAGRPEAKAAGTVVLGIDDMVRRNRMKAAPLPVPPIDFEKLDYSVDELLAVPENVFIPHLYRCLLKRDPDPGGAVGHAGRWIAGELSTDIILDISRSPEALKKGVRVKGLRAATLRRGLSKIPVVGRLFDMAANLVYLPELARQFRTLQHRPQPNNASGLEMTIESLRAELSALVARANQEPATPPAAAPDELEHSALLLSLEEKVDIDHLNELLADKVTARELAEALDSKASLEQLARLEQGKADRIELSRLALDQSTRVNALELRQGDAQLTHEMLLAQTRRVDAIEQRQGGTQLTHEMLLAQIRRVDSIEQEHQTGLKQANDALREQGQQLKTVVDSQERKAEASAVAQLANSTTSMYESLNNVLTKLTDREQQLLSGFQAHKLRILDIERRLALLLEEARKRLPAPMDERQISAIASQLEGLNASQYADFEDIFRGTREDIKNRQSAYLPYLEKAPRRGAARPILDVGCGRGEFLEMLHENGHEGTGVDSNPNMVERCRELGLQVERADGLEYLRGAKAGHYAAVTAFHVVEHVPHPRLLALLDEAFRALRSGGLLILETPNPKNLIVGASNFYMDPTHLNPIPPEQLRFVVEARGFVNAEIKPMHPVPEYARPAGVEIPGYLADLLYGPQDYAVVAWKV